MCLVYGNDGLFKGFLKDNMSRLKADPWSILCSRPGVWRQSSEGSFKGRWPINNAAVTQLTQKILEVGYLTDSNKELWLNAAFQQPARARYTALRANFYTKSSSSSSVKKSGVYMPTRIGDHEWITKGGQGRISPQKRLCFAFSKTSEAWSTGNCFLQRRQLYRNVYSAQLHRVKRAIDIYGPAKLPSWTSNGRSCCAPRVLLTLLILTFFVYCQSPLWLDLRCESGTRDIIVKLLRDEAVFLRRRILLDAQKPSIWWKCDIFLFRKEWAKSFFRPNSWNEFRMLQKSTIQLPSVYVYLIRALTALLSPIGRASIRPSVANNNCLHCGECNSK